MSKGTHFLVGVAVGAFAYWLWLRSQQSKGQA